MVIPQDAIDFLTSPDGWLLSEDVQTWAEWYGKNSWYCADAASSTHGIAWHCNRLFEVFPEFRSLFDYRTKGRSKIHKVAVERFPRATDLVIGATSIGPRFRIQHGHGTYIFARDIGSDFWVNQLVTIGSNGGIPRIGNNVSVRTGAVVVGAISIGNNVKIGANSVVHFDMLDGQRAYAPRTIVK